MSAIAGIVRFDGAPVEPGLVERMTAAMAYRGRDGIDHWSDRSVALGHCRSHTTPESIAERAPLANDDGSLVLAMDGRVDNADALRRELVGRGGVLRDRTDAELVLRAYEAWGESCPARIDGDFAFVVWDARRRTAFCARDRFGQKPFHYHWDGRTLAFASDVHALLALPWVPQVLNEGMVAEFLGYEWISLDETFWEGVMRLPQAHAMNVDARGPRLRKYWEPDLGARLACRDDGEYAEHYRALLFDAVRSMSRTIGPLACEASGGLDSSALLAVAEHLRRDGRLLAPSLDAYTLAFTGDSAANELDYARAVGAHLGLPIHEIEPTHRPLGWYRERAGRFRTFPALPNGTMGLGIRRAAASRGSRALLVGQGGDQWLCGSSYHYAEALAERDWRLVAQLLDLDRRGNGSLASAVSMFRHGLLPLVPSGIKRPLRRIRALAGVEARSHVAWLSPAMARRLRERRQQATRPEDAGVARFSQSRQLHALEDPYGLHARHMEDQMAAECGIELRRPFWNHGLVAFAFATPEWLRLRGNDDKFLHRRAMNGLLPRRVVDRRTKAEFVITYLRHHDEIREAIADGACSGLRSWFDPRRAAGMCARFGLPDNRDSPEFQLWAMLGCIALRQDSQRATMV